MSNSEYLAGDMNSVAKQLLPTLDDNCVVIGLGAGTITNLAKGLKKAKEEL